MSAAAISENTSALVKPSAVGERAADWKERIRDFHLTGKDPEAKPADQAPAWLPAAAAASIPSAGFPLHYQAAGAPEFQPLQEVLDAAFAATGEDMQFLAGRAADLADEIAATPDLGTSGLGEVLPSALRALRDKLGLEDPDAAAYDNEGRRLQTMLRKPGRLLPFEPASALYVHLRLLAHAREAARAAFVAKARAMESRLEGLVHGEAVAEDAAALAQSLGEAGDQFFDPDALAHSLKRTSGHKPLAGPRRDRVRQALDALRDFLAHAARQPHVYLIHAGDWSETPALEGVEAVEDDDPYAEALRRFGRTALIWQEAFRAIHIGELEVESAYVPARHDRAVARLDWESAAVEELEALPAFLVVESAERLAERSLTSWGRMLRSGRPIQAIVTRPAGLQIDELGGSVAPDAGFMAMAYREALVVEAPLAAPAALLQGLARMARSLRTCLAVIAVPDDSASRARNAAAAHAARVTPSYVYDPKGGESWAQKFSLRGNAEPEKIWTTVSWSAAQDDKEIQMEAPLTPADAAALEAAWRRRFLVIPAEAWSDDQMELGDYLALYQEAPPDKVPFIWAAEASGRLGRAIVTREIANACREVRRSWRTYQELAGVQNAYVESAVEAVRQRLTGDNDFETARMVDEAKRTGAAEAVYRLVAALADPRGISAVVKNGAATTPRPAAPAAKAEAKPVAPEPPPPAAAEIPEGPYIDSALCTSCNECINLNPRMFQYNENKQAYIADATAGPYKTLVKAAAACPAQCIHPGPAPR